MVNKIVAVLAILILAVSFAGCKKKEEGPQLPAGHPPMNGSIPPGMQNMPKIDRKVKVSQEVKATWKAVKLAVENKASQSTKEYTVKIGQELAIPNTGLKVKVLYFLPDFKMMDKEIVSTSNKPNMPAVKVAVSENGKEIWNNWLFSLMPGTHPFPHDTIGIVLVGGVSK